MKQKLQTTSIPNLEFEDYDGNFINFSQVYNFIKSLGCGTFGFVVSATEKRTGDLLALKVKLKI